MTQPSSIRLVTEQKAEATYLPVQAQASPQHVDTIRRGRLGRVGTSGKGVVSIRFDHQVDPFLATLKPLFDARRLPFSMGLVTQSVGNPTATYEPTNATWADVKSQIIGIGGEIWAHSRTHGNGGGDLESEIVGARADIEAQGIRCMGWQQPGSPATYGTPHTSADAMNDRAGQLIRSTYGLYESSIAGSSRRALPTDGCWGHNHITIDTRTLANVKGYIDEAANFQVGVQLMLHPQELGRPGYMTLADFTGVLDYLVTMRDAGKIEVVTASALAFADPGSTHRTSLMPFGSFEGLSTASIPGPWSESGASWTIGTDGGHSGSSYLRVPASGGIAICRISADGYGIDGFPFMFEGWARAADATAGTNWRAGLTATVGATNINARNATGAITQAAGWQRVRLPMTIPVGASSAAFYIGRAGGGAVDWDDVSVVAI